MLEITPDLTIPDDELDDRFVQAGGPGGQNVNVDRRRRNARARLAALIARAMQEPPQRRRGAGVARALRAQPELSELRSGRWTRFAVHPHVSINFLVRAAL